MFVSLLELRFFGYF